MKKAIIAVIVLIALLGGATWLLGGLTERGVKFYLAKLEKENPLPQLSVGPLEYERGFLKSEASNSIGVSGLDEDGYLKHEVFHGPVAMTPDGLKPGLAYIVTTLDRARLSEAARTRIDDIYGEDEPFTVKTSVSVTGGRRSEFDFAAVDHSEDGETVRFDGATGFLTIHGPSGAMESGFEITPISLSGENGDGEDFTIRVGSTSMNFSAADSSRITGGGAFGKLVARAGSEEPTSLSLEEMAIELDYQLLEEGSSLYLGSLQMSSPELAVKMAGGEVSIRELKSTQESLLEGDMVTTRYSYVIDSIEESFLNDTDYAAISESLKKGVTMSSSMTLPKAAAELLQSMQSDLQSLADPETGEMSAAGREQMADAVEASIKSISKGTGIEMQVSARDEAKPMSIGLALAYVGDGVLTDTGSLIEVIDLIDLELNAELPGDILESLPEDTAQSVGMLVASGTLVKTPTGVKSSITLNDGTLLSNGQPNLLYEQMKPMLAVPMDWEDLFDGIRQPSKE